MCLDIFSYKLGKKAGGGSANLQENKTTSITSNGTTTINPDTGYDGMKKATITTNVQPNNQTKSITIDENTTTTITPDQNYDGLSSVEVTTNVSGGGDVSAFFDANIEKCSGTSSFPPYSYDNLVKKLPTLTIGNNVTSLKYYLYNWPFSHLAFEGLDLGNITDISYMFSCGTGYGFLTSIDLANISNTANLYNIYGLFSYQKNLVEINNMFPITPSGSNFFVAQNAFSGCEKLIRLDLSNWVGVCLGVDNMFRDTKKLAILDISNLQLSRSSANITYTFLNCGINCLQSDGAYADGIPYIYVKDATEQSKILGGTGTPATWSTNNVVIKQTPSS